MDYKKDIRIDESALDVEWTNQPSLAFKYGQHWAELSQTLADKENAQAILRAEINDAINADTDGLLGKGVKSTEANKESFILQHPEYRKLNMEISKLKCDVAIAKIAYNEISVNRKTALENLVKLGNMNYFAIPSTPRNLSAEIEKKQVSAEKADSGIASKLRRTK